MSDAIEIRHLVFVGGTSEPGGLHIHTADVVEACAALGCDVSIICRSVDFFTGLLSNRDIAVDVADNSGTKALARSLWAARRRIGTRFDVVLCRGAFAESRLAELAIVASIGRRVYTIDHRPWTGPWASPFPPRLYGRVSGALIRRSIAVSEEITTLAVQNFGFPRAKIATCLNWVHTQFSPVRENDRRDARAAFGLAPENIVIGYAGRVAPEKRIDVLLQAFAMLPDFQGASIELAIVGDGWKRQELTELARKLGVADRVRFCGWLETPQAALAACDVFVLPSLVEGFPLALMEAMAMGLPCLAHPMSGTRRLIDSGKTGVLADLTSPAELAAALHGLVSSSIETRQAMGQAAAARIAREFSRETRLPCVLQALDVNVPHVPEAASRRLAFDGRSG